MKDTDVYTLRIPTASIAAAVRVAVKAGREVAAIDEERRNAGTVVAKANVPADRQNINITREDALRIMQSGTDVSGEITAEEVDVFRYAGTPGVQKFREKVEEVEKRRAQTVADARAKLDALHTEAVEFIDKQVTPDGKDLLGDQAEGDAKLLDYGLIDSPEELAALLDRHDNATFRKLAARYADDRSWEGFMGITKEANLREFTDMTFDGLTRGVAFGGINRMQWLDNPGEPERVCAACGLIPEWQASGADAITKAYSE